MGEQFVIDASALVQGFIEDADTTRVLTLIQFKPLSDFPEFKP